MQPVQPLLSLDIQGVMQAVQPTQLMQQMSQQCLTTNLLWMCLCLGAHDYYIQKHRPQVGLIPYTRSPSVLCSY